jgi:flagellar hook-associated protein 2
MGIISASTGLNSGIDIAGTVSKLMAISSKPRDALTSQNTDLTNQQTAVTTLSALLLSVQYITTNLGKASVFSSQTATSSNSSALSATVTGTPAVGTYQYTPLQTAQSQQFLSSGLQSATSALGGGKFTFRYGNTVNQGVSLSNINGGKGFTPGSIRITDRSGASAQINLTYAQNIDDVLQAINSASTINVTATAVDGHIQLTDNTGQTVSDLKVQEVGNGKTAASLGLSGIDVAGTTANGQNILTLSNNILLSALNDGMGVRTNTSLPDITYTLHDGTSGTIDLSPILPNSSTVQKETTLGDIANEISTQTKGKLQLSIAGDGQRLVLTDTTAAANPGGTLTIGNDTGSTAASDLGLVVNGASSASVTGSRILGGLKTVLLSDLNGGQGLGNLGYLKLTDRKGNSVNINLSGSETLEDVVDKINGQIQTANAQPGVQAVGITAQINQAGDGIELVDTTGSTNGSLTAANSDSANDGGSDGTNTAVKLGLATASGPGSSTTGTLDGGDLHLRTVSRNTLLSSLNGGAGIATGSFTITDSSGNKTTINVTSNMQTVGDVIDAINRNSTGVHADVNATGDGILLTDTANAGGTLSVAEGNSTTAHDLNLLSTATNVNGTQTINGSTTRTITLAAGDTLTDLQNKINALGDGLSASILTDGSSTPYRLTLTGTQTGTAGQMVVDTSQIAGMSLGQLSAAQNALLAVGAGSSSSSGLVVSSSTNTFTGVLPGVSLQVNTATGQPVSVSITSDDSQVAANLQTFVTNYNKFRSELATDTAYNTTTNTGAVLSDDTTVLQLDTTMSQLVAGTFSGNGKLDSLADVGVTVRSDGTLSFDQSVLDAAWAANPTAVQQLFTTKHTGISDQFKNAINGLAGDPTSLLAERISGLQTQIANNQSDIELMNLRLTDEQNRLYTAYYNMDLAVGKFKSLANVISNLAPIDPYIGSSTGSSTGLA